MLQSRTYTAVFSFEQPEAVLDTLLPVLRQSQELPAFKVSGIAFHKSLMVLLIDEQVERTRALAHLLQTNGYRVQVVASAIDAFTLVLREAAIPFAMLVAQEHTSDRFFLTRLMHQVVQKHAWKPLYIELYTRQTPQRPQPRTESLSPLDSLARLSAMKSPMPSMQAPSSPSANRIETPLGRLHSSQAPLSKPIRPALPAPRTQPEHTSLSMKVADVATASTLVVPAAPSTSVTPVSQADTPTSVAVAHRVPAKVLLELSPSTRNEMTGQAKDAKHVSLTELSIGRYHMQALLGSGPLGSVYRTYDRLREHDIALKAVQLDTIPSYMNYQDYQDFTSDINLFQQEIDVLRILHHPHILIPLTCSKSYISGSPFLFKTMRYCTAGSLSTWLYTMGAVHPLTAAEVAHVVVQVADALQLVHSHHLTYQNFKLSNLLLQEPVKDARNIHVLLSDFALTQKGAFLLKTPDIFPYIAPERWQGQSLPASDQYGLAALAYELLTGRQLFSGHTEQVVKQLHITMPPQPPSSIVTGVSPAVDRVLLRALAKRPEERFPTITAFAEALRKTTA